MKHMKRFVALFAALALVLAMAAPAFAATASPAKKEDQGTGIITVENAKNGETYSLYRIFDLVSYTPKNGDEAAKAVYKVTSAWESFVQSQGAAYITLDKNGQPTWQAAADVVAFVKLAKSAAESISPVATVTAADNEAKFTSVKDGYYLVSTTTGTLCSLNTENGTEELKIRDKNDVPTVEKKVERTSGESVWEEENTAKIGDTVSYQTTISVKDGAKGYVLHDKMDAGLTLDASSIKVVVNEQEVNEDEGTYSVKITKEKTHGTCTFEIEFADSYVATLADKDIIVTYKATLNGAAKIVDETNKNETWLKYGDSSESVHKDTETKAYSFDLVKTNENGKLLKDAQFELYEDEACTKKIALIKVDENTYRPATVTEKSASGFASAVIVSNETNVITIKGLKGETTYYLKEIKAPQGYNTLTDAAEVKIGTTNLSATMNGTQYTNGGVHVTNKAGTTLPGTGGIGTTIFYLIGGGLMVAAAVLLIAKKRMENK